MSGPIASLRQAMRRGSLKLLILNMVSAKPMHGYEIAKEISSTFNGMYEPSPGVIYPTLQWLEDQGYVRGNRQDGKITYKITDSGKKFLKRYAEELTQIVQYARKRMSGEVSPILRSGMHLQKTITMYLPEMSKEKRIEVAKILDEAKDRITRLMK